MAELSVAAQTAISYLDDVEKAEKELDHTDNCLIRERYGLPVLSGDLRLAYAEANGLEGTEKDFVLAQCHFREGMIKWSLADGFKSLAVPEYQAKVKSYTAEAAQSFQKALDLDQDPRYYYYLGLMCVTLKRPAEAVKYWEQAAAGDNSTIAIEARKQIGRIGPVAVTPVAVTASSPTASVAPSAYETVNGSGSAHSGDGGFVRQKAPNWGEVTKGGIALVIGVLTAAFLIGIPIALWGIYMIAKGFIQQVDV